MLAAASCHTADEIARAGALDLDFAVLGPVARHADASGCNTAWLDGFARLRRLRASRSSRWAD